MTAVTVRFDELPDAMEAGDAVMVTVGAGFGATVTVALADIFPPAPVEDAV